MRGRGLARLVLVTVAFVIAATTADAAAKLSSERATRLTESWAAARCEQAPTCVKSAGRYCYPLSETRRRCTAQVIHREANGNLVQCQTMLYWRLDPHTKRVDLTRVGKTRCD